MDIDKNSEKILKNSGIVKQALYDDNTQAIMDANMQLDKSQRTDSFCQEFDKHAGGMDMLSNFNIPSQLFK